MFGLLVYLAFLATLTVLSLRKPSLALVAILSMYGLEQWGQIHIGFLRENSIFTNLYILLLLGMCVFLSFKSGAFSFQLNRANAKIRLLGIALLLYALLSVIWSPTNATSLIYWQATWPYWLACLVLAPLLIGNIHDLQIAHKYFVSVTGVLVLLLAFVPEWGNRAIVIDSDGVGEETLHLPLALAQLSGYLLIVAAINVAKTSEHILWLVVAIVGCLFISFYSDTRGALLFSSLCIVAMAPLVWSQITFRHIVLFSAAAIILGAIAVLVASQLELSERWAPENIIEDLGDRLDFSITLLEAWATSITTIVFGLGNSASFSPDILGIYPHIVPLEILGEEGLLGFAIYLAFIVYTLVAGFRIREMKYLSAAIRKTYIANFACFLYALLLSFKQGSFLLSYELFMFAVIGEKFFYLATRENRRNQRLSEMLVRVKSSLGSRLTATS